MKQFIKTEKTYGVTDITEKEVRAVLLACRVALMQSRSEREKLTAARRLMIEEFICTAEGMLCLEDDEEDDEGDED